MHSGVEPVLSVCVRLRFLLPDFYQPMSSIIWQGNWTPYIITKSFLSPDFLRGIGQHLLGIGHVVEITKSDDVGVEYFFQLPLYMLTESPFLFLFWQIKYLFKLKSHGIWREYTQVNYHLYLLHISTSYLSKISWKAAHMSSDVGQTKMGQIKIW